MKLSDVVAQWIVVRTFGYAVNLLHELDGDEYRRPSQAVHIDLLRSVCTALYRQILEFVYPERPAVKSFTNQWP